MMQDNDTLIRALEPEDLEYLYKWENDMALWEVSDTLIPFSRFTLKKFIENAHADIYASRQLRLAIARAADRRPVGLVDLYDFDPYHRRGGLGIMIYGREHRRRGHATSAVRLMLGYCFGTLGLNQVYSIVPAGNAASLRLFRTAGFVRSGCRRQWLKRGDGWEDAVFFQRLASDWRNGQALFPTAG